jgi:hypothetical protein
MVSIHSCTLCIISETDNSDCGRIRACVCVCVCVYMFFFLFISINIYQIRKCFNYNLLCLNIQLVRNIANITITDY